MGILIQLFYQAFNDKLGADPVEYVIHFTGIGAFNLLILSLLVTPLIKAFKWRELINVRRLLGLYSFSYALMHLLSFLAFDVQFDWLLFAEEIIKRPYIMVGMISFLILLALAITSLAILKKRMKSRWQLLHNCVYLVLLLVGVHFYWSVKSVTLEPIIYLTSSIVLISLRRQKIIRWFKLAR